VKYFLYTAVHDYEGTFGDITEHDTEPAARAAAAEFEKGFDRYNVGYRPSQIPGYDYKIIEGRVLTEGGSHIA
jgi:hypothetical protein